MHKFPQRALCKQYWALCKIHVYSAPQRCDVIWIVQKFRLQKFQLCLLFHLITHPKRRKTENRDKNWLVKTCVFVAFVLKRISRIIVWFANSKRNSNLENHCHRRIALFFFRYFVTKPGQAYYSLELALFETNRSYLQSNATITSILICCEMLKLEVENRHCLEKSQKSNLPNRNSD